ncbi:class A beta-lactamase [Kushneria indalinina]|uniref:beta-lactamase n=1 Tax=Kushneria indalinina DSM 14324 TaxID=1122140 RepID=A0A3D9E047_9GAMM|nr:class A beta-lactamase [Kushneria indalinina]REC96423.1 beta-lactamase class A [Kushneria indalinina DSM 14324]
MKLIDRRRLLCAFSLLPLATLPLPTLVKASSTSSTQEVARRLQALEQQHKGRLGVALMNVGTGAVVSHRGDERFLFNSTGKVFIAAAALAQVDRGEESLDRRIEIKSSDLTGWTPVTEKQMGSPGMTIAELGQAAVAWSDNAAANLLIESLGGPAEVTAFLRGIGDTTTRLDRTEPTLNEHEHDGDERDTTTPRAMMQTLRTLLLGEVLSPASRHQLAAWMIEGKTGDARLRAGMPSGWLVGEKTGTNSVGNAGDIGIAWPSDRGAVIVIAYVYLPEADKAQRDQVIAEIGKLAAKV